MCENLTTPSITDYTTPSIICSTTPGITNFTDNIIRAYIVLIFNNNTKKNNSEFLVEPAVVRFLNHGEFEKKAVAAM